MLHKTIEKVFTSYKTTTKTQSQRIQTLIRRPYEFGNYDIQQNGTHQIYSIDFKSHVTAHKLK